MKVEASVGYEKAKAKLEAIHSQNGKLLMRDYDLVANQIRGEFLEKETDDPVYRAYLELKNKNHAPIPKID